MKIEVFKRGEDIHFGTLDNDTVFPEHFEILLPISPASVAHSYFTYATDTIYTRQATSVASHLYLVAPVSFR